MNNNSINSVYFIGLGAIGAKYASKIYDFNPELVKVIVNDVRLQRYTENGIYVNEKRYDFSYVTPAQSTEKADLIIVGVKSYHLDQAIEELKPFVGPNTQILSLLNGIDSVGRIAQQIGEEHVLYSIVYMDAVRRDNRVSYKSIGKFVFGEALNTIKSAKVQAVAALFDQAGIPYEIPENMELALWRKFMINIVINQVSFLVKGSYHIFQDNFHVMELMQL
ncbi:ketopantoate reductase family protein, partial [Pedobacter sp.]|uniref:ketopantoate reductase family protein n=1 Tax=Pedobacter sp. TaxID=1411316 RepID=UPI003D7FDC37